MSNNKMGHPLMHKLIAHMFWTEENLEQARHHYLLSRDGTGCGKMLIELSQSKGYSSEIDLFIAQVVRIFLTAYVAEGTSIIDVCRLGKLEA